LSTRWFQTFDAGKTVQPPTLGAAAVAEPPRVRTATPRRARATRMLVLYP
jgi:hypothetical protein